MENPGLVFGGWGRADMGLLGMGGTGWVLLVLCIRNMFF